MRFAHGTRGFLHCDRAGRVGLVVVQRRRQGAVPQRQQTRGQLGERSAGAHAAGVTFYRPNRRAASAEYFGNAPRLPDIGRPRTQAMGVDMIDVFGLKAGLTKRSTNGACQALAGAALIESRAEADQLGYDGSAPPFGMLQLLDAQHAGAFTRHDAVAALFEGT